MVLKVALAGVFGTAMRLLGVLPLAMAVFSNPLTYLVLNTVGCAVTGVVVAKLHAVEIRQIVSHGVLGAFTTFSGVMIAAGRIGHSLSLVAEDTSRMTATGLLLAFGYIAVSLGFGLLAYVVAKQLASR